ncbi:magnesium-transporting ATPase (P-type) [Flavobacterium arsenatis]|uniref:Magnesium-transporting ATPase (P-type) n=1 Tax=Flavobacterium arsenatis TaxID=1484332 RepID=A0ABU1TML6_9FLAO|nr:magnesium-transporting ATPase (P-type) [Flavobacterium arsenatis]
MALLPKRFFSLTGLVVGSMIPDFEYFLRMKLQSNYSHTLEGVFWFDLPLGILASFAFHNFVKKSFIDNLPLFLKSRFSIFKAFDWNAYFIKNWLIICISILIGAFSHLLWDSFTHYDGYFVNKFPILQDSVLFLNLEMPILKIAQHASTFLGAILIFVVIIKMPTQEIQHQKININYWFFIFISSSLVTIFKVWIVEDHKFGNLLVTYIASLLLSLIFCPLFLPKKKNEIL